MARVLVVDDEAKLGALVAEALALDGHSVARVAGGRQAVVELGSRRFDVVVTDLRMPDIDGLAVLRASRARDPAPDVILMTAHATAESAVQAMKEGAADYLTKPFAMDELCVRVRRLDEQRSARERGARLLKRLTPKLVAESPAMRKVLEAARQVAGTDATVLLLGDSGTGKSQVARFIHYSSKRAAAPLVEVQCVAFVDTLLESELFGHEKGAFTDAKERKEGHLAAADGGSLFLDEIGEVSGGIQVKLLRFLQDKLFIPVGSIQPRSVDVRIIAATNRNLAAAVKEGSFREDFYYRLNVFAIEVPPLRDRREDIIPIANSFLASRGLPAAKLSGGAQQSLLQNPWRGNVRELENALERALILAGSGAVEREHLVGAPAAGPRDVRADDLLTEGFGLDAFERSLIHAAIARAGGNKAAAARLLGITRRRLYSLQSSLERGEREDSED